MINDYIHLSEDDYIKFAMLSVPYAKYCNDDGYYVPADLINAKTVPLRDMVIEFTSGQGIGSSCMFTFPKEGLPAAERYIPIDDGWKPVGLIALQRHKVTVTGVIISKLGEDKMRVYSRPIVNGELLSEAQVASAEHKGWVREIKEIVEQATGAWYGIQIALLNPYVKDVFRTKIIRKTGFNPNGKKRKSIVKYVRHHYLNPGALSPDTEAGQMLRKTMTWYVCGHWRRYQDGKTIFIQPYWKGPLRETKVCEPRERIVI